MWMLTNLHPDLLEMQIGIDDVARTRPFGSPRGSGVGEMKLVARPCGSGNVSSRSPPLLPTASPFFRHRLVIDFRALDTWKALAGGLVAMITFSLGPADRVGA